MASPSPFHRTPFLSSHLYPDSSDSPHHFTSTSSFLDPFAAVLKFLPSSNDHHELVQNSLPTSDAWWLAMDAYSCDDFRMYEFKVRRCMRGRSHDWTECPFAHPGEKARRRDPRRFHYAGTACPDFRKGNCKRGDACEYAHGVFECWLHPGRYRTELCKDGVNCKRRVCFFAHTVHQLRVLSSAAHANRVATFSSSISNSSTRIPCYDTSPVRKAMANGVKESHGAGSIMPIGTDNGSGYCSPPHGVSSSPTSTLVRHADSPGVLSPPISPPVSPPVSPIDCNYMLQPCGPIPAHRTHVDNLRSLATISIPSLDDVGESGRATSSFGSMEYGLESPDSVVADIAAAIQALRMKSANHSPSSEDHGNHTRSNVQFPPFNLSRSFPGASPLSKPSISCSSDVLIDCQPYQEEGAGGHRATTHDNMGKEADASLPDIGWVNELVE